MSNRIHFRGGSIVTSPGHGVQLGDGPAMPAWIGFGEKKAKEIAKRFPAIQVPPNCRTREVRVAIYRRAWDRIPEESRRNLIREYPELGRPA